MKQAKETFYSHNEGFKLVPCQTAQTSNIAKNLKSK